MADFSGYIAADELYDGPFCVLSLVDNRRFTRLVSEVREHDPTHQDIQRFFARFQAALTAQSLTVRGITPDASPLYPVPIAAVFGPVPHQVCEFHTVAELTKAVLKAVARVRTKENLSNRIALDRLRDAQAAERNLTTQTLHLARTGS